MKLSRGFYPFRYRRAQCHDSRNSGKKVGVSVYWFTKAGGDAYFGKVASVPYSQAKKLFNDHVKILAENERAANCKGLTAGDLIVLFLEWIEKKRSRQTFTTRKLYCTRFADFEVSPGTRAVFAAAVQKSFFLGRARYIPYGSIFENMARQVVR